MTRRCGSAGDDIPAPLHVRLCLNCRERGLNARVPEGAPAGVVEVYTTAALYHPPDPVPGAAVAVRALAARGPASASDTARTHGAVLRWLLDRWGLVGYPSAWSDSDEVGLRKPEPAIFTRTLDHLGVALPPRCTWRPTRWTMSEANLPAVVIDPGGGPRGGGSARPRVRPCATRRADGSDSGRLPGGSGGWGPRCGPRRPRGRGKRSPGDTWHWARPQLADRAL